MPLSCLLVVLPGLAAIALLLPVLDLNVQAQY